MCFVAMGCNPQNYSKELLMPVLKSENDAKNNVNNRIEVNGKAYNTKFFPSLGTDFNYYFPIKDKDFIWPYEVQGNEVTVTAILRQSNPYVVPPDTRPALPPGVPWLATQSNADPGDAIPAYYYLTDVKWILAK
jgi:hypothetical protein